MRGPNFVSLFSAARSVLRMQQTLMHAQTAVSDACAVAVLKNLFRILQVCFREVNYASVLGNDGNQNV